jgi:hypothetical protein
MIQLNFTSDFNNIIFNDFHNLTDGNIILGGSSVLRYHNIIARNVGNLNLALNTSDIKYFEILQNHYNFTFIGEQKFGLINKTYWFKKNNKFGAFYLVDNQTYDLIDMGDCEIRMAKLSDIHYNKSELIKNGDSNSIKHYNDVEMINKFYGEVITRSII